MTQICLTGRQVKVEFQVTVKIVTSVKNRFIKMTGRLLLLTLALLLVTTVASVPTTHVVPELCWGQWYDCMRWSALGTGTTWQACTRRCQCLGWTSGDCIPVKNCAPTKPWKCHCRGPPDPLHYFEHMGLCSQ